MGRSFDFVVVGAGIVGLALARELRSRNPKSTIAVFEKELHAGEHASGRNSGVLHSGIYYQPQSVKAAVSVEGRKLMTAYCEENGLSLLRAGKVILPARKEDDAQLDLLYQRAISNGVRAELVDEQQLSKLEPFAHSPTGRSLFVPDALMVQPKQILNRIVQDLSQNNVHLSFGSKIESADATRSILRLRGEEIAFGHLYNSAGVYADVVARAFEAGRKYRILPFKGIYYKLNAASGIDINHLVYAVPDLRVPFLGIHFMKNASGEVFLGPTVLPAFGRENYSLFHGLSLFDTSSILLRIAQQYAANKQGFRRLMHQEGRRFLRRYFAEAAQALVPSIKPEHLLASDKVGIRAQLLNTETRELVMDFVVERSGNSTHVLNAVSPAFTSSFAFAKYVLDSKEIS